MIKIDGTTISMTRGDTLRVIVSMEQDDYTEYLPVEGETLLFAMKRKYSDAEPLITKNIPYDTRMLQLDPEDTKPLNYGSYVYDISITRLDGTVDTFIDRSKLVLTEEVG